MNVWIVIPTYNEKKNLRELVDEILNLDIEKNILIVDDNSPDGTGELADELSNQYENVFVLHRKEKSGLGTAYIEGFKYALSEKADYIFEMDADFSHDPQIIPVFLEKIKEYDIVIGSRYLNGISVVNWPLSRLVLSLLASTYVRLVLGLPLKDCTSGFKCFRRRVLENINLDSVSSNGYAFQIEMNYRAYKKGFKLGEVSIIFIDRHSGSSKMSKKIIFEAILIVWKLLFGKKGTIMFFYHCFLLCSILYKNMSVPFFLI